MRQSASKYFNTFSYTKANFLASLSDLGTLKARSLPKYLDNNVLALRQNPPQGTNFLFQPLPNGYPWGTKTVANTNPKDAPNTGITRHYDFTISRGELAPDGYLKKSGILINGQFPGPLIEANWGDWIEGA